jgi:cytochrome b561
MMLALLVAVYGCIELRELYPRGSDIREGLKTWHFMLGGSVFVLVWIRLGGRWFSPRGPLPGTFTGLSATAVHLALYVLMIAMPVLGWLLLSAEGKALPLFGLSLPPLIAPDKALAGQIKALHTTVGVGGYWLIGLHATAALFHHFVLRDATLRQILPGRHSPEVGAKLPR